MEDLEAEAFLADKAYDTNELLDMLKEADITAVIPPVKSRKEQRAYSYELYRARHVIEKRLPRPQALAGNCHTLRKALRFLHRRHSCQVFIPLSSSPRYLDSVSVLL
jgi:transposase